MCHRPIRLHQRTKHWVSHDQAKLKTNRKQHWTGQKQDMKGVQETTQDKTRLTGNSTRRDNNRTKQIPQIPTGEEHKIESKVRSLHSPLQKGEIVHNFDFLPWQGSAWSLQQHNTRDLWGPHRKYSIYTLSFITASTEQHAFVIEPSHQVCLTNSASQELWWWRAYAPSTNFHQVNTLYMSLVLTSWTLHLVHLTSPHWTSVLHIRAHSIQSWQSSKMTLHHAATAEPMTGTHISLASISIETSQIPDQQYQCHN